MILRSISLRNYRQHRELDIDFTGHMIAVIGRNGSGKSNFLGAIQFALTGEQPGFNKEDLLNWEAAKSNEGGYVDLSFEHNGVECRIQRRIEKPAVTLTVDGEKFTGTKKVQEHLELMGIDKDVLRQSVFVRQTEVESVLFDDPRERELAFQKLVGLGDAAKHQKFLTDFLAALAEPKNLNDEIERQKDTIESQKASLKELENRSREMDDTMAKAGDESSIMSKMSTLDSRISLIESAISKHEAHDAAVEGLAQTMLSQNGVNMAETDLQWFDDQIDAVKDAIVKNDAVIERNKQRSDAVSRLESAKSSLGQIPSNIGEVADMVNSAKSDLAETRGRKAQLEKLLADAPDGNVCPLCGSTTDHNIKAEIQSELDKVKQTESDLASVVKDHGYAPALLLEKGRREDEVRRLEEYVDGLGPNEGYQDREVMASKERELREERAKAATGNERIRAANTRLAAAKIAVDRAKEEMDKAMAKIPGNHTVDELGTALQAIRGQRETLFASLGALSQLKAQKAELDGGISQLRKFITDAENGLAELERLNAENQVKTKKIQVIRDVKDWFSYKNGPRVMSQAVMGMLVDETNKFLNQFGSPFVVTPMEEGMGFRCVFTDGRVTSEPPPEATMLSGGQKIALAVAFRFAVYMMFAGKLGLLSLDEPTAYLDDETISRFADLLGKIRDLAANMGVQCLVSTHESSLSTAFDQTISIGR